MSRSTMLPLAALSVVVLLACTLAMREGEGPGTQMKTFAVAWVDLLDDAQKAKAVLPYDTADRTTWKFVPLPTRKGLPLMDMNVAQQTATLRLLRAALSEMGYDKSSKIMQNESFLRILEGPGNEERRNPEKYYAAIYGTPSAEGTWGFSFEGHHLSLNFVIRDGKVVDSTPQFFASNPATILSDKPGPLPKGARILRLEEELAFEFVNKLSDAQRAKAIIAEKSPAEIQTVDLAQPTLGEPAGILVSDLDQDAQQRLMELIQVYVNAVPDEVAKERLAVVKRDGSANIYFAWAGPTKPGVGHYYRIQGKSFLIEFVNTQPDAEGNPANHIHAVYRDMTGDFDLPISPAAPQVAP